MDTKFEINDIVSYGTTKNDYGLIVGFFTEGHYLVQTSISGDFKIRPANELVLVVRGVELYHTNGEVQ